MKRTKGSRGQLASRCRPVDRDQNCLCLGIESGGFDIADSTPLGQRTVGFANQHEIASQETGELGRTGRTDDQRSGTMAAQKAVSSGCGRVFTLAEKNFPI